MGRETNTIITATVATDLAEIVADRMWQWGVQAVGTTELDAGVVRVFTSVGDDPKAVARALATLDDQWNVTVEDVEPEINAVPAEYLSPTWYRPNHVCVPAALMPIAVDDDVVVTVIDQGAAFGLGDHPTTSSTMALMVSLFADDESDSRPPASLLDVGCGTGALAILAAQYGVPTIRAIDIADAAVESTRRNMALNDVVGRIEVDTTPVGELDGSYDVIVANILAPTLISMADDLQRLLASDGVLIISGILVDRHEHVLDALRPLATVRSRAEGEWIAIMLR